MDNLTRFLIDSNKMFLIRPTMKRLILTALFAISTFSLSAIDKQYVYTQISQQEGLTATVNCIYKEKDGAVWIGTPNGLYSFNGYSLNHYGSQIFESRRVFQISMDKNGDLWVLTDKHVLRRDAISETFSKVSSTEDIYYCMTPDNEGFWIGGLNNLYRYSYSTDTLAVHSEIPTSFDCRTINLIDQNTLLCCSHSGKMLIDLNHRRIYEAPFGDTKEVSATLVDNKGRIWFAIYNKGLEVFDANGTKLKSYTTENSSLSNNIVLCLAEKGSKTRRPIRFRCFPISPETRPHCRHTR